MMREEILEVTRTQHYTSAQPTPMQIGALPDRGGTGKKSRDKGKDGKGGKGKFKGKKARSTSRRGDQVPMT